MKMFVFVGVFFYAADQSAFSPRLLMVARSHIIMPKYINKGTAHWLSSNNRYAQLYIQTYIATQASKLDVCGK